MREGSARSLRPRWTHVVGMVLLAVALAFGAGVAPATAQEEGIVVRVDAGTIDSPLSVPERPEVRTTGDYLQSLTILVDGRECGRVELVDGREAGADAVATVNAADAACTREGARVRFEDAFGRPLHQEFTIRSGEEIVVTSLVFAPPSSNPGAPDTGSGFIGHEADGGRSWHMALIALAATLAGGAVLLAREQRRR